MANPEAQKLVSMEDDGDADEYVEDISTDDDRKPNELTSQLMQNPQVLAALQDKLGNMIGSPSGYIQSLPKPVKRRLKALKKLQSSAMDIESEFYKEVHLLECKYAARYQPLLEKRHNVVSGSHEPTDEECEWPSDDEEKDDEELAKDLKDVKIEGGGDANGDKDIKGVPEFWLTIFKNVDMLSDMVQEHDEPILKSLDDIKVHFFDKNPMGFKLEFFFTPNDFFTNSVLTKEYEMKCKPDEDDVFSFEGPEIVKCKGCKIDWKPNKNVTVKVIKKKQKHKTRGAQRTVTKTVQADSFFNFFSPPAVPEGKEQDVDEETESLLAADFEIGHFIRERIVPRAVLYFTGEALEDDSDYDGEEEEEDGDDDLGDVDEEHDPDFVPQPGQNPAECKQQ